MSVKYKGKHWTEQYGRIMVLWLETVYGNRTGILRETGLSLAILSRLANGDSYHISINTMARLEDAVDKALGDIDNAKEADKNGTRSIGNGATLDDFPKPPYGILREV